MREPFWWWKWSTSRLRQLSHGYVCQNWSNTLIICKLHVNFISKWYKKTQLTKQIDKPQNGKNYSQNVYITKDLNSENIKNSLIIKSRSQIFKWANNFSKLFIRDMTIEKTHEKVFNIMREKEITVMVRCHSIQFSHSVLSDSLWPHGFQHARLSCLSPTPGAYSNSCPLRWWCHPTISSSVIPFSSHLQSFPVSGSFPMSQFFASGGQSIGVSASASVLPMNIQDWFPLGLTVWISLEYKGLSRVFSNTTIQKHRFFGTQLSL